MVAIANTSVQLECHIRSQMKDTMVLTTEEVRSIKLQVEMAINSMSLVQTNNPDTLTGIRVHIKGE